MYLPMVTFCDVKYVYVVNGARRKSRALWLLCTYSCRLLQSWHTDCKAPWLHSFEIFALCLSHLAISSKFWVFRWISGHYLTHHTCVSISTRLLALCCKLGARGLVRAVIITLHASGCLEVQVYGFDLFCIKNCLCFDHSKLKTIYTYSCRGKWIVKVLQICSLLVVTRRLSRPEQRYLSCRQWFYLTTHPNGRGQSC